MNVLGAVWNGVLTLFGAGPSSSGGGKDIVKEVADVYSNYNPGEKDKHQMTMEESKQTEQNINDARQMQFAQGGANWFDILVNGLNRLPRPLFALWAFSILGAATFGAISSTGFQNLDAFSQSLIKEIVEFFFGVRVVSQDIPNMIKSIRGK